MEVNMKTLFIVIAVVAGLLLFAGIAVVKASSINNSQEKPNNTISCSSCGGGCTASRNCGLSTCGAVTGGKCGCGKR
jgi:hypothetical protein